VFLTRDGSLDLTYCTNIHAADGWPAVFANLRRFAPPLKARFAPDAPFGLGLRLSAREARALLAAGLDDLRAFLDDEGLYVAVINGFPYGSFHGAPVKTAVYAPDWRDPARADYTLDLIRILASLLPFGMDGGISTAPLSYKAWMPRPTDDDWRRIADNLARVTSALVEVRHETGARVHLDIEPEPDCVLETSGEVADVFDRRLVPLVSPLVAAACGTGADGAVELVRDHIGVCFDCCHVSVEHEDPIAALTRLRDARIRIGRVQLSSALRVTIPDGPDAAASAAVLAPFADTTYLHQVVRRHDGRLHRSSDLGDALARSDPGEWRVHFHVPLFAREFPDLGSTQDDVARVIVEARERPFTTHLEIETYTWDVLPSGLVHDLGDSIAREYDWVLDQFANAR
jgi:sugar phosphate isomerase/epimerase